MEATQGSPRHATHAGDEKPPQWRWLAMALAVAVIIKGSGALSLDRLLSRDARTSRGVALPRAA